MGKRKEAWMEDGRRSQRRSARLLERGRDRSDRNPRRCKVADHPPRRCEVSKAPLRRCQVSKATFVGARPLRHCQISEAHRIRQLTMDHPFEGGEIPNISEAVDESGEEERCSGELNVTNPQNTTGLWVPDVKGHGKEEVLLDWNGIAEQFGYVHIGTCRVSLNHKFIAYTLDTSGSELFIIQIKDLTTGCIIPKSRTDGVVSLAWAATYAA